MELPAALTDKPTATPPTPLSVCSQLAGALIRARRLDQIFEAALDSLANGLGIERSSILLFDADDVMRFKAWRGLSEKYRSAVEGHTPWTRHTRNAQPIFISNVAHDAELAPYRELFREEEIAGLGFVPLEGSNGVIGKFMLYFREPRSLSSDELLLVSLIASQIAFAVERIQVSRLDALEESNRAAQRLAAIVESSDDAIVSKDLQGIIKSWNRGAERLFGYTEAEVLGKSITIIVPKDRLQEEDLVLSSVRAGQGVQMETLRQRKDGSFVPIALTVSPVKDFTGRIIGASKIARDISARKRAESERTELHRRLTMLVNASATLLEAPRAEPVRAATLALGLDLLAADACALWCTDAAGAWYVSESKGVSPEFAKRVIHTYRGATAPSRLMFTQPLAISDLRTQPMVEEQLAAYDAEGIRSMLVCPMRVGTDTQGTLVFYFRKPHTLTEVDLETGQALANLASAALTTAALYDQQRAQHEAAELGRRRVAFLSDATAMLTQTLDFEQTLDGLAKLAVPAIADWCAVDIFDESGALQRLSVAHVDPSKVELARELQERFPPRSDTPVGPHAVARTGRPLVMESITPEMLAAAARNEEHRLVLERLGFVSILCVPLISTRGIVGALTFGFAESGRHYTTSDLPFAQDVAARAALALDNAFAYLRVQEANRLKDEFLATLSHELRTPLNAVLGYAQMLKMDVLPEDKRENALDVMTRNAEALRQIIDDVLDVSRITSGKLGLNVGPVRLSQVVSDAIATVRPGADAKGVEIREHMASDVPMVSGDPDRLQQVTWNVLSNAVKFTQRGGHIDVRVERNDGLAQITVKDDGLGIDPAFLPHIFERFRQADSRFSREHGGLGLGLSIVRELVELHGGTVGASSPGLGGGATFTIRLPASPQPDSSSQRRVASAG